MKNTEVYRDTANLSVCLKEMHALRVSEILWQSATIYFANVVTLLNTAIRFYSTQFDFHTVPFPFQTCFRQQVGSFAVDMDNLLSFILSVELTAAALKSQKMTINYQIRPLT